MLGAPPPRKLPSTTSNIVSSTRLPVVGSILKLSMPSGMAQPVCGTPFNAELMKFIQIGSADCEPVSRRPSERGWS
jgi:hypothetical protein